MAQDISVEETVAVLETTLVEVTPVEPTPRKQPEPAWHGQR
jgi:hypothetical protein